MDDTPTSLPSDPSILADLAESVALEAARLVAERRAAGVSVAATKSAPVDVVTQADRDSETLIRRLLREARPGDGFLGEESEASGGTTGITWVVDPIDGTVNYLYGIPHYAVSIAAVDGSDDPATWRALAGVVVSVVTGEVYRAVAGGGATRDGEPIGVARTSDPSLALVGTGFGYDAARRQAQGRTAAALLGSVRDLRRLGSAAIDLCLVADGRLDAFYERGLNPWDQAAGALIAAEAGATVAGLDGRPATSELLIAARPELFASLEPLLAAAGADRD